VDDHRPTCAGYRHHEPFERPTPADAGRRPS